MEEKDKKKTTKKKDKKIEDKKEPRKQKIKSNEHENEKRKEKKIEKPVEDKEQKKADPKEIIVEKQTGFNILEVLIIMFITLCFGGLLGSALTYASGNKHKIVTTVPAELKEFTETYEDITDNYYEDINKDELLGSGIKGMLNFLGDKYSVYMNEEESEDFNQEIEGKYVGIGSEIKHLENGDTIISNPFEDGPAKKAGLQVDDIILKVDGEDITGLNLSEISNKVKGKEGTVVRITVKRGEETLEIPVIRGEVELSSVESQVLTLNDKKIGYIKIDIFAANTGNQFEKELLKLESDGITALIIDVRSNSGGYLSTANEISSLFLEKGKNIYQLDTKGQIEVIKDTTKAKREYPVAVLINQYSASASEILASAIKESYDKGFVVGVNSYGKGTVQKATTLKSGATVKYTIQKWLTPNGNWINEVGVEPTHKVEQNPMYAEDPIEANDTQLQSAKSLVIGEEPSKKIEE